MYGRSIFQIKFGWSQCSKKKTLCGREIGEGKRKRRDEKTHDNDKGCWGRLPGYGYQRTDDTTTPTRGEQCGYRDTNTNKQKPQLDDLSSGVRANRAVLPPN